MERLLIALAAENTPEIQRKGDVYIIGFETNESRSAVIQFAHTLRMSSKKNIITDVQNRSLKAQMKEADKLGIEHAIIIGPDEAIAGTCIVKHLKTGMQYTKKRSDLDGLFEV
jgi:histidyl-tRNA synthetase